MDSQRGQGGMRKETRCVSVRSPYSLSIWIREMIYGRSRRWMRIASVEVLGQALFVAALFAACIGGL